MAQRKKRRPARRKKQQEYPGWVWMIFGLAIGLSVAFAVYVKDKDPAATTVARQTQPASMQGAIDDNGENASNETEDEPESPKGRFDFYDMLPAFEMTVDSAGSVESKDVEPHAIEEPGVYMLQAGSFSTHNDADRRKAELALHGIEARVQRVNLEGRDYYRVYIGPIDDLDRLNLTRSRLRAANIDVMRIRVVE